MWRWSVCDNAGERYCPYAGYTDVELDTRRPRVVLLTRHKQFACLTQLFAETRYLFYHGMKF